METSSNKRIHQQQFEKFLNIDLYSFAILQDRDVKIKKFDTLNRKLVKKLLEESNILIENFNQEILNNIIGLSQNQINSYIQMVLLSMKNYEIIYTDEIESFLTILGKENKNQFEIKNMVEFQDLIFKKKEGLKLIEKNINTFFYPNESDFSNMFLNIFFNCIDSFIEYYMIIMFQDVYSDYEKNILRLYNLAQQEINKNIILLNDGSTYLKDLKEKINNRMIELSSNKNDYRFDLNECNSFYFLKKSGKKMKKEIIIKT